MMLKTSKNIELTKPRKNKVKISGSGRNEIGNMVVNNNEVSNNKISNSQVGKKKNHQKISKSKKPTRSKDFSDFFICGTRLVFIKLRQMY